MVHKLSKISACPVRNVRLNSSETIRIFHYLNDTIISNGVKMPAPLERTIIGDKDKHISPHPDRELSTGLRSPENLLLHQCLATAGLIIVILFSHLIESAPAPSLTGHLRGSSPVGASNSAKSYLLKPNIKKGDKEIINYKLEASADVEVPAMPEHPVIPLYSRLEQEIEQKILNITDTQISRMERIYRSSKYYTNKKSKTPKMDSLDGKKIIIEPDGTITPTDLIPPKIKEFISTNEHRFSLILPKEEIRPQAEWTIPSEIVVSLFNFSNNKKRSTIHGCTEVGINAHFTGGSLRCLLKKVQSAGLQEIAVIEMIVTLKGKDNGLNIDTTLKGTALFDIAKARFNTIELSGDLNLEGNQPCVQSGEDKVIGKGKINISYEFK